MLTEGNDNVISLKLIAMQSGTSVDGIDVGLFDVTHSTIKEKAFRVYKFKKKEKEAIINGLSSQAQLSYICELNFLLGNIFAKAVIQFMLDFPEAKTANAISSHGQTIWHQPREKNKIASTLQLGEPSVIANKTNKMVVSDFRSGEISMGGEGAPLAPYFDYTFLRTTHPRLFVNIGGICNFTIVPSSTKNVRKNDVVFTDCGTGNIFLDQSAQILFKKNFDKYGEFAKQGKVDRIMVESFLKDKFFCLKPPKSTGREHFSQNMLIQFINKCHSNGLNKFDIMSTLTEITAESIYSQFKMFTKENVKDVVVSGGGALNKFLIERIKQKFGGLNVYKISEVAQISEKSKEVALFASLGFAFLCGKSASMKTKAVLGKLTLPPIIK